MRKKCNGDNKMDIEEILNMLIETEYSYSKKLKAIAEKIKHPTLSTILLAIARDSEKHGDLYKAILKLMKDIQPMLSQEELLLIRKEIDRHIETESRMIESSKKLLERMDDPRIKILLEIVYEDEVKHHKALINIRDRIAKVETIEEEDIWTEIWKHSPWHGGPGG